MESSDSQDARINSSESSVNSYCPLTVEEQFRLSKERARKHSATYYAKHKEQVKARLTTYNARRRLTQQENLKTLREGLDAVSLQILSLHQTLNKLERPRAAGLV
jgi:hypothetical protein